MESETVNEGPKEVNETIGRLQAMFRGARTRKLHISRLKAGELIICPFVASTPEISALAIDLASITSTDCVVDLGCGDGSVLIEVALRTGAKCFGFDIDEVLCARAVRRAEDAGVKHLVNIEIKDILSVDL